MGLVSITKRSHEETATKDKMKTKIIHQHNKNCAYITNPKNLKWHKTPWGIVEKKHLFLGKDGRAGGHYYWLKINCNDPNCNGEIIVRALDVLELLPSGL